MHDTTGSRWTGTGWGFLGFSRVKGGSAGWRERSRGAFLTPRNCREHVAHCPTSTGGVPGCCRWLFRVGRCLVLTSMCGYRTSSPIYSLLHPHFHLLLVLLLSPLRRLGYASGAPCQYSFSTDTPSRVQVRCVMASLGLVSKIVSSRICKRGVTFACRTVLKHCSSPPPSYSAMLRRATMLFL